jgi:DNA-binding transcriptional MerR regulator
MDQIEAAKLLGIDARTLRRYTKMDPPLPSTKANVRNADYSGPDIVEWFVRYQLQQFKDTLSLSPEDKRLADAREALARAELREIELATTKGELLKVKDVETEWSSLILMFRQTLLNLPHILATTIDDGLSYQQRKDKVQREIDTILKTLAEGK